MILELFHYFVVGAAASLAVASIFIATTATYPSNSIYDVDQPIFEWRHWPKVVWTLRIVWIIVGVTLLGRMIVG